MTIVVGLGMQKSGTTSLYYSFVGLNSIFAKPKKKECHYFENNAVSYSDYINVCFDDDDPSKYNLDISPRYMNAPNTV